MTSKGESPDERSWREGEEATCPVSSVGARLVSWASRHTPQLWGYVRHKRGKMRGLDGANRPESTQAGGWGREEAGLNEVFVEEAAPLPQAMRAEPVWWGAIPRGFSLPYNFPPSSDGWVSRPFPHFLSLTGQDLGGMRFPSLGGPGWDNVTGT